MPNYVKEYISIEEFLILQQWKVPYTGFFKGVGYTYPQYDAVEFPLDWSIPNWTFGNYISHPLAIQIIDTSPEAVFQSMNYSEQDILNSLKYYLLYQFLHYNQNHLFLYEFDNYQKELL